MEPHRQAIAQNKKDGLFESIASKSFDAYCGLAFERLCLKNMSSLLNGLGISWSQVRRYGPYFRQPPRTKSTGQRQGLQIDILIERIGHVFTLIECKFSPHPVGLSVVREVESKIRLLHAPKSHSMEKVLIAPGGITSDLENSGYFHKVLGVEAVLVPLQ